LVTRESINLWGITENKYISDQRRISRKEQYVDESLNNKEQYTFHHLALFVTDTNVYVKEILLSTDPPLVRDILISSDPLHNPRKLSFRAN
jgi:hypothetical protein